MHSYIEAMRSRCTIQWFLAAAFAHSLLFAAIGPADEPAPLRVSWKDNYLTIAGPNLPGREMEILYLEAYCRPGSTDRKWEQTLIGHKTKLLGAETDGRRLRLRCTLDDGVV